VNTPGTPSRITGVLLGEARFDFLRRSEDPLVEAHFALVRSGDGAYCGKFTKMLGWSPKVTAALEQLRQALEEDAAKELFDAVPGNEDVVTREPQQI